MTTTEWVERYNRAFGGAATKRITPEVITHLEPNEVFVFGSNRQGRHGKGAALQAMKFGAVYGRPSGHYGDTYAIVTKELRNDWNPVSLEEVKEEVDWFKAYVEFLPCLTFLVTPIGCNLAGFKPSEIGPLFKGSPPNVVMPERFLPYV